MYTVFIDTKDQFTPAWVKLPYIFDFEPDKFAKVYSVSEADIIPVTEHTNLHFLLKNISPSQIIMYMEVMHSFEHQGKSGYKNFISDILFRGVVNKIVILTPNSVNKSNNAIYVDFLFNRQKYYFTSDKIANYGNLLWTWGATKTVYSLSPITKIPKKKFLSPNRVYENIEINPRSIRRAKLHALLLEHKDDGYINNTKSGALFLSNEMTTIMVSKMGQDSCGGGTWNPIADWYYNTSYVSIYVETITRTQWYALVTEKTFDPLIKGNFILPFAHYKFIELVKHYGFQLPEWIDYSYDNIVDDDARFLAYLNSVNKLLSLSLNELNRLYLADKRMLDHNRKIFYSRPYDKFYDRLQLALRSQSFKENKIKRENESLEDYKTRMMDTISPTYCAAKWYNATIWLGHGQTTSCHHPPAHKIDVEEIKINPSAIHNTKHKKLMRKLMLEGQRPNECEYCWKVEDIGRNNVSDRTFKTKIYDDDDVVRTTEMPWDSDVDLKTLEISFERTCNFACSYCNPAFSTAWVRDIKQHGPYINIVSDGRGHFADIAPWAANATEKEEDNPYVQAFWKWWNSSLSDNLEEIRITGGEPLMAPSVWKLFDWFKENPEKGSKMRFAINSNLVPKDALIDKLIAASDNISHLDIYTSNESFGAHSEYIRDGMDYSKWRENVVRLLTDGNIEALHCMMTINSLCLASITEFMDDFIVIKKEFNGHRVYISLNILRFPSFQSCAILPDSMKKHYKEKIAQWLAIQVEKNESNGHGQLILNDWERSQVQRLIDYLDVVKTPHQHTAETSKLYNDFRSFYEQYDQRRGKDFRKTFPADFVEFIDSIKLIGGECAHVSDPATTAAGYASDDVAQGWDTKNDTLGKNE